MSITFAVLLAGCGGGASSDPSPSKAAAALCEGFSEPHVTLEAVQLNCAGCTVRPSDEHVAADGDLDTSLDVYTPSASVQAVTVRASSTSAFARGSRAGAYLVIPQSDLPMSISLRTYLGAAPVEAAIGPLLDRQETAVGTYVSMSTLQEFDAVEVRIDAPLGQETTYRVLELCSHGAP